MGRFLVAVVVSTLGLASATFGQQVVQRVAVPGQVPDVVARSKDLGPTDPSRTLHLVVSFPYGDPAGIVAFVDSVSNPSSPNYRQFLTPEQVGARFGISDKQVQGVVDYLTAQGFKIILVGKNHLSILADATVAQAEKAFGTSIHEFQAIKNDEPGNTRFFSITTDPTLPAEIAPNVIDIAGLESFTKPQPRILNPTQARTLYSIAPMYSAGTQGQGRTIGISSFDGFRLTNIPLYYSQFGLPTPPGGAGNNITVVTIGGGSGSGTPGGEGDLDIQMPLGVAPLCNIRVYDGGSLTGVLTQEVNENLADVISESYGWNLTTSGATAAHNLHLSMSAQGITYMAASGDSGTSLDPFSYPNYDPEVLMVGGTVASVNSAGNRTSEVGWSGSGGGWSTKTVSFNLLPSWQQGTGVPTGVNKRLVPDVALSASGSSGAYYFFANGTLQAGAVGTSFASPVFAGSLAVAEQQIIAQGGLAPNAAGKQRFGRIQDLFYSQNGRSDVWFDVTSGSNGTLPSGGASTAGAGWDSVTGWGAINFNAFVASVATGCASPAVTASPASVAVCSGATTGFSVNAVGSSLEFQWLLGSTPLNDGPTATGAVISGSATRMMTITGAQPGDAGSYSCLISNTCGQAQGNTAVLTVNSGPVVAQQPVDQAACASGSATFSFALSSGDPTPTFQWQWTPPRWGTPIDVVDGVNSDPTSGLPAFTAQGSNTASLGCTGFAGAYRVGQLIPFTCTATNLCATQTSNAASLHLCIADFDCNGSVSVQDIFDFLNAWFAGAPGTDIDASGATTVLDIFDFLNTWFAGCP
ncbi:MAG TPA: protease pro-enzyme activation domain-containing protein [Phycisphaerales bacterium]|nr:protease pro-enzyme activation domain-containing protein [Phycisphaerales bacterium]